MSGERLDYGIERQRHQGFIGREAVLAELDWLLVADETDRWVVVTGGPGMGKSAILAAWLARRQAAGAVVPHHFIRRGEGGWDEPAKITGSLAAQIEESYPAERDPDARPESRLMDLLARVSARALAPRGGRLVLLIDGLDEYDAPAGAYNPLAAFLPQALPRVRLLCASRPRHPYLAALEARGGALTRIDLDDPSAASDNDATVRAFWQREAAVLGLDDRFIEEAAASAGGNMQHAVTLRKHQASVPLVQRRVEAIPRGLGSLLTLLWRRVANHTVAVHGLGILCAAREPLSLDELGAVVGWDDIAQREAFKQIAFEFLIETRREGGVAEYRLHHDSIRAHIVEQIGPAIVRGHHAALTRRLATWPAPADGVARRYTLRHALAHRAEAGDWAAVGQLAGDLGFLETKCREFGVHDIEADVARAAERCRASGDEAIGRDLGDLARALARESHWLHDEPGALAAQLWNRLWRMGWSVEDLGRVRLPTWAPEFMRVRHAVSRESRALLRDLTGHFGAVNACVVTTDGRRVVSASDDKTLKVWDLDTGRVVATLEGHTGWVMSCAVTPDGRRVVSASGDQTLEVWDLGTGRVVTTLEGHTRAVNSCAVTPNGRRVISVSDDQTLKIWDLSTGRVVATLEGHTGAVNSCAVARDDCRLVTASDDGMLNVWDLDTGRVLATLEGHTRVVNGCAVTPDGRCVVSASDDKTLKVWDLDTGRVVTTLEGHTGAVNSCAVTPDGRRLVSASSDKTLKVWDLATYQCLTTLRGDTSFAAVAATTTTICAGDAAGTLWFLDWPPSLMPSPPGLEPPTAPRPPKMTPGRLDTRRPRAPRDVILFLAANPSSTSELALGKECDVIQRVLRGARHRDFDFQSRWAVSIDAMMDHLNELSPTIIHFSGHGAGKQSEPARSAAVHRDIDLPGKHNGSGIYLQDEQGGPQLVTARALRMMIESAAATARVVVLNACYSEAQADALCSVVDCVIGMTGAIRDEAARAFAVGFYRALGNRRSVGNAVDQAVATLAAKQLPDEHLPRYRTRDGVDAYGLVLGAPA
jgi:WD40 repeat protein